MSETDIDQHYDKYWRSFLESEDGQIDKELLKKTLCEYDSNFSSREHDLDEALRELMGALVHGTEQSVAVAWGKCEKALSKQNKNRGQ